MKPGLPWSVKGVEPDAREAAKVAARRAGMTLGEWLNSTILDQSASVSKAPASTPSKVTRGPASRKASGPVRNTSIDRAASRLEDIAEHLASLSRRDMATAPVYEAPQNSEALNKILSRIESNERQTVEAFTAVNERLSILGRQMAQAAKPRLDERPEESPGYIALEKAVRNIIEHMEASEKRTRDNFKALHERVSAMSSKAAQAPDENILRQAPIFSQLESRLSDLASRIERTEAARQGNTLPDTLKRELTDLAGRIDTVRETAESLAMRAQTQAVQASQRELRAIEERIVGLVKEAKSSLMGNGAGPAEMQRIRSEIERINARIDEAQKAQASGGDLLALRAAVEQLSTRVAQGPDMRPFAEMDRRLQDVTKRLEQTQAQTRNLPQFGEIERRIAELDYKLNEAVAGRASAHATEIEERLGDIVTRVDRTERQLGSLETIERAVNQLFDMLEQQKAWTQEVADNAAARMAQQVMAQGPQQVSLAGAPEIQALQDGLQAVRQAAEAADQRNQETLEAVHETLEQIVGKLAELETAAIGQRVAQAAAVPVAATPEPVTVQAAPAVDPLQPVTAPEVASAEPLGLDPFQAASTPAPALAPEPAPAAESDLLSMARKSMAESAVTSLNDDFIAAARRAAQASFQHKSVLSGIAPGAAKFSEESSKKLMGFSLFSRGKKTAATKPAVAPSIGLSGEIKPPPGFKPANSNTPTDAKKRKLVILGLVLLAAVSAFTFNLMGQAKKPKVKAQPAAIEQTIENPEKPKAAAPVEEPEAGAAQPPQPKPAELESNLESDPLLTTGSLGDIVSGSVAPSDLPPEAVGTLALREAAAMGNTDAQFIIATRYLNGEDGAPQDFAQAAYWYGKAAAAGSAPAQYRLGTLYERGKGVAKDLTAALSWYERAASLGNVTAMHNAAVLAAGSGDTKPDYKRAYKWFALGAAHGLRDSQFNLAVLLERGLGTKANLTEALFWYTVAGNQADADAAKRAEALKAKLPKSDALAVEARVKNWIPEIAAERSNSISVMDAAWQAGNTTQG